MKKILYHPKAGTTGFFLMTDVPEEPLRLNTVICDVSLVQQFENEAREYFKAFELAKEEAIKNGEIVNPDALENVYKIFDGALPRWAYLNNKWVKDGDLFDVPENLNTEETEIDTIEDGGGCFVAGSKKGIILVPSDKEEKELFYESQERLWKEFFNIYIPGTEETFNDNRQSIERNFTIQRKSK